MEAINTRLHRSFNGNLEQVVHFETNINQVEGLLGQDGAIKTGLFPAFMVGGIKYIGTISASTTAANLYPFITSWLENALDHEPVDSDYEGKYFVATTDGVTVSFSADHTLENPGDGAVDGGGTGEIVLTLQSGDWLVYNRKSGASHVWGLINNTYSNATENTKGVVQLASKAEAEGYTNALKALTPKTGSDLVNKKLIPYATQSYVQTNFGSKLEVQALEQNKVDRDDIIAVAFGGTGASTVAGARENLGVGAIGTKDTLLASDIPELAQSKITGLVAALAGKTAVGHGHAISDVSGLNDALSSLVPKTTTINGKALSGNISLVKSDVGLGSVQNYGLASSTQAKAGTSNALYMTPLRTKELVDVFATIPLYATLPTFNATEHPEGKLIMVEV